MITLGPLGESRIGSASSSQLMSIRNSLHSLHSPSPCDLTPSRVLGMRLGTSLGATILGGRSVVSSVSLTKHETVSHA